MALEVLQVEIRRITGLELWELFTFPITYPTTVVRDFCRRQLGGGHPDADL
jgi:hypothetical protein